MTAFFIFFGGSLWNIVTSLTLDNLLYFVGANICAMLFADLMSGIVHWGSYLSYNGLLDRG